MRVARAFDHAADYDRHAVVQKEVACGLAAAIGRLPLPRRPRTLEIGCGTGFLGAALIEGLPDADWWMTDIAPAMLVRAKARLAGHRIRFALMDGSEPHLTGPFDLICSSLAFQWLPDLSGTVGRLRGLLAPGGHLAFTTLAEGSFATWRRAHGALVAGTPDYPSPDVLAAMGVRVSTRTISADCGSAVGFLRGLKAIGAGTPRDGHEPLRPAQMREVMARFDAFGARAEYVVATCVGGADVSVR